MHHSMRRPYRWTETADDQPVVLGTLIVCEDGRVRGSHRVSLVVAFLAAATSACSGDDSSLGDACISKDSASVCAQVNGGALTLVGAGLQPGSVVRAVFDGEGSMEWAVSGSGDLEKDDGAIGWLSMTPVRVVSIEAVASDGSRLAGDIDMP